MKSILVAIIVIIVIAGGAFAVLHKSPKPTYNGNSQATSQSATQETGSSVLATKTNATLGQYFAGPSDRALYTYGGDTKGVSNCTGSCLQAWPAYTDKGSTTNLPAGVGTIKRSDNGEIQFTYNGLPLYFFASDSAGQVTGNGVQNFSVAKPASASTSTSSSSTTPSASSQPNSASSGSSTGW